MHPISRRLALAALGGASLYLAAGATVSAQDEPTFALVQINQQALFFNQMNEGAQSAADAAGANLVVFNANNDPAAQNNAIETYIQQEVDGLIVVAIDVNGVMPAVMAAVEAGIPVVAVDAVLPDGPHKSQVGVNNELAGGMMGDYFVEYVGDGGAKIGIVGALNSAIQNLRQKGFEDKIDAVDTIETVGVVDGRNIQDNALAAAENLLTGNPDMTAIYATGEPALLGALAAVESQGRTGDVKVFGWDLTAQAIAAIDAGHLVAVIQQDPAGMGAAAVDALVTLSGGGDVDAAIEVPITIVTTGNVDDFRSMFQ
ncbi:substrate-binding domain-containing protein [Bauldia sp.]|uniref:substrate-binding domain-containing protein n=1 Tax=Bauldia sp. TaxID=2575872 RepID=UPI003BA91937